MTENVFSQLRRLVNVEGDVQKLQHTVLHRKKDEDVIDTSGAVLLLRDLQKDVQKLKANSLNLMSGIRDDKGFKELVPLCEKLLELKVAQFEQVQSHLVSYGYSPIAAEPTNSDDGVTPPDINTRSLVDCEAPVNGQTTATPAKIMGNDAELDRTPTLEDFGLSEAYLDSIAKRGKGAFKASAVPAESRQYTFEEYKPPGLSKKSSSSESIPEIFKSTRGITITPGLFNARSVAHVTPGDHLESGASSRKPEFATPNAPTTKQMLLTSLAKAEGDNTTTFSSPYPAQLVCNLKAELTKQEDSPQMPVFVTPGLKQMFKPVLKLHREETGESVSAEASPAYPVFNTPGLNKLCGAHKHLQNTKNESKEDSSKNNTPEYPTFNTPGLKKMQTQALFDEDDGTPDTPDLVTTNFRNVLPAKLTYTVSPYTKKSVPVDSSASDAAYSGLTTSGLATPQLENRTAALPAEPRLKSTDHQDDLDIPETPELTYKFTGLTKNFYREESMPQLQTNVGANSVPKEEQPKLARPHTTRHYSGHSHGMDDDLPPDPDLSDFSMKIWNKSVSSQCNPSTEADNSLGGTGLSPQEEQASSSPSMEMVKPITAAEYVAQPSWVQRQLSTHMLDDAVHRINTLLTQKMKEGKALTLNDKDIGSVGLSYVLVNTKRIIMKTSTVGLGSTYTLMQNL